MEIMGVTRIRMVGDPHRYIDSFISGVLRVLGRSPDHYEDKKE